MYPSMQNRSSNASFRWEKKDFLAGGLQVTLPALRQLGIEYSHNDYPKIYPYDEQ